MALAGGALIGVHQWQRAEAHLARAREAVVDLGWAIDDATFWHSETWQPSQEGLAEMTRRYAALLESLDEGRSAEPVDAAAACFLGRVDGLHGKTGPALDKLRTSVRLWRDIVYDDPQNLLHRQALARTLQCYGTLLVTLDSRPDGLHCFEQGKLHGWFDARNAQDRDILRDYAELLSAKADSRRGKSRRSDAAQHFRAALEVFRRLAAAAPKNPDYRFRALQAEVRLAALQRPVGTAAPSSELRSAPLAALRALVLEHPDRQEFRVELATVAMGMVANTERYDHSEECESLLRDATSALKVVIDAPDCPRDAKQISAKAWLRLAQLGAKDGRHAEARVACDQALREYAEMAATGSERDLPLAQAYRSAAALYSSCGDQAHARRAYQQATVYFENSKTVGARSRKVHLQHSDAWSELAALYREGGRRREALSAYENAIRVLEEWRGAGPREPHVAAQLARLKAAHSALSQEPSGT